jgi:hypothetical protein
MRQDRRTWGGWPWRLAFHSVPLTCGAIRYLQHTFATSIGLCLDHQDLGLVARARDKGLALQSYGQENSDPAALQAQVRVRLCMCVGVPASITAQPGARRASQVTASGTAVLAWQPSAPVPVPASRPFSCSDASRSSAHSIADVCPTGRFGRGGGHHRQRAARGGRAEGGAGVGSQSVCCCGEVLRRRPAEAEGALVLEGFGAGCLFVAAVRCCGGAREAPCPVSLLRRDSPVDGWTRNLMRRVRRSRVGLRAGIFLVANGSHMATMEMNAENGWLMMYGNAWRATKPYGYCQNSPRPPW